MNPSAATGDHRPVLLGARAATKRVAVKSSGLDVHCQASAGELVIGGENGGLIVVKWWFNGGLVLVKWWLT